jgi:hypothetical protein
MAGPENSKTSASHSDIVESELLEILQQLVDAGCGLSAIHQLLDEATTMSEIRARFEAWQAGQKVGRATKQ